MAINASRDDQLAQGAGDLANKLKLEEQFKPKLKRFFRRMADDLEASVLLTGGPQPVEPYIEQVNGLLQESYANTRRVFSGKLVDQLEDEPEDGAIWTALLLIGRQMAGPDTSKEDILLLLRADTILRTNEFIRQSVATDTTEISRTNAKDLELAVATASVKLNEELERQPTRKELAAESRKRFLKHDLSRNVTIAATTTQKGAEGMKAIDRDVFVEYRNGTQPLAVGLQPNAGDEFWVSVGDSVVRPAHLDADGQKKENGVFIVMGQQLRYPGDKSLGATAENVINCRCSDVFSFSED